MKKAVVSVTAIVVFFIFTAFPCTAKTTWNANVVWPPSNHHSIGMAQFAEKSKP